MRESVEFRRLRAEGACTRYGRCPVGEPGVTFVSATEQRETAGTREGGPRRRYERAAGPRVVGEARRAPRHRRVLGGTDLAQSTDAQFFGCNDASAGGR